MTQGWRREGTEGWTGYILLPPFPFQSHPDASLSYSCPLHDSSTLPLPFPRLHPFTFNLYASTLVSYLTLIPPVNHLFPFPFHCFTQVRSLILSLLLIFLLPSSPCSTLIPSCSRVFFSIPSLPLPLLSLSHAATLLVPSSCSVPSLPPHLLSLLYSATLLFTSSCSIPSPPLLLLSFFTQLPYSSPLLAPSLHFPESCFSFPTRL